MVLINAGYTHENHEILVQRYCFVCVCALIDLPFISRHCSQHLMRCFERWDGLYIAGNWRQQVWPLSYQVTLDIFSLNTRKTFMIAVIYFEIRTRYLPNKEQSFCCWSFGVRGAATVLTFEKGFVLVANTYCDRRRFAFYRQPSFTGRQQLHERETPHWKYSYFVSRMTTFNYLIT